MTPAQPAIVVAFISYTTSGDTISNPALPEAERIRLTAQLMAARRAIAKGRKQADSVAIASGHAAVEEAKQELGERGPVWWNDGSPDLNRRMARNTPYADWLREMEDGAH